MKLTFLRRMAWLLVLLPALGFADTPVSAVNQVDLARYVGHWYEIARLPMFWQRQCKADTTADYTREADGTIKVVNRCRLEGGSMDEARGKATVVEGSRNARLKVSFFWPFKADYWIIGLDPDYRWALVGTPNHKYLWLLSRTPTLPEDTVTLALSIARTQGYDLTQLIRTPQSVLRE